MPEAIDAFASRLSDESDLPPSQRVLLVAKFGEPTPRDSESGCTAVVQFSERLTEADVESVRDHLSRWSR